MANDGGAWGYVVLLVAGVIVRAGCNAGVEAARDHVNPGVLRAPAERWAYGEFSTYMIGEKYMRAMRSPRDEDRSGMLAYLAGVHDTAAVLAAQELVVRCCEPAALALDAALDEGNGEFDAALAAAPPSPAGPRAVEPPAPLPRNEQLPADLQARLTFLQRGGFTQTEVRKKFPDAAHDPALMRCLPP